MRPFIKKSLRGIIASVSIAAATAAPPPGYNLTWSDEFDGTELDPAKWVYRDASSTDVLSICLEKNVVVTNGMLDIQLFKENYTTNGFNYKFTGGGTITARPFRYGYYEVSSRFDGGYGWHEAFWAAAVQQRSEADRPRLEIDPFQHFAAYGPNEFIVGQTEWYPVRGSMARLKYVNPAIDFTASFNRFAFEFTPEYLIYYLNEEALVTIDMRTTDHQIPHNDFYLYLSCIGTSTNATSAGLCQFDYLRCYEADVNSPDFIVRRNSIVSDLDAKVNAGQHSAGADIWIQAEDLPSPGGWTKEMNIEGVVCLRGNPPGLPEELIARGSFNVPESGTYHLWVRSRDFPGSSVTRSFSVAVNGTLSTKVFCEHDQVYVWEYGGSFELSQRATLELIDTSYYGRCDKALLTTDPAFVPNGRGPLTTTTFYEPSSIPLLINSTGFTATASGSYTNRDPVYAINGAGMTGDTHTSSGANGLMWMGDNSGLPKWFKVDLGQHYDLHSIEIYNFNWAGYTNRGCKNVQLYYSNAASDPGNPQNNPDNWKSFGSAFDLAQAPGTDLYNTPDIVGFPVPTRWVSLKINSTYGDGAGGLSEVRFRGRGLLNSPGVPTALSDIPGNNSTALSWAHNPESTLWYYKVYRSKTSGGPYTLLANTCENKYFDDTVTNGATHYYAVTAVNTLTNESGFSSEYAATPHSGFTVTASGSSTNREPVYAVNGEGMTGDTHTSSGANNLMWQADGAEPKWIKIDLGQRYDLDYIKIYNFNWAGYTDRGARSVLVCYSDSNFDPGNPVDNLLNWRYARSFFDLTQAPGANDYGTTNPVAPDTINISATARWVAIKVNSDYGGGSGGLSEIRFYGRTADLDADGLPDAWEIQHFAAASNCTATADPDHDGSDNYSEYSAGTNPNDPTSVFKAALLVQNRSCSLSWDPKANRLYDVEWTTNIITTPFIPIQTNLTPPQSSVVHTNSPSEKNFYRITVRNIPFIQP